MDNRHTNKHALSLSICTCKPKKIMVLKYYSIPTISYRYMSNWQPPFAKLVKRYTNNNSELNEMNCLVIQPLCVFLWPVYYYTIRSVFFYFMLWSNTLKILKKNCNVNYILIFFFFSYKLFLLYFLLGIIFTYLPVRYLQKYW